MSEQYPWGEVMFERNRNWYSHLPLNGWHGDEKAYYKELQDRALSEPEFDLFAEFMPTGKPKHDIGRYVMRHSVDVPIISTHKEWQEALLTGRAMLRSESRQDYAGESGLFNSHHFVQHLTYPKDEYGFESVERDYDEKLGKMLVKQLLAGPPESRLWLGYTTMLTNPITVDSLLGNKEFTEGFERRIVEGLVDGSINPTIFMKLFHWDKNERDLYLDAQTHRYRNLHSADYVSASHWQYVPGVNIRILRDEVIKGKYFIGGREAHHHWEVTDGAASPDVEAHDKAGYRGRANYDSLEYTLPTARIINLYEKIRTLPFFDQRQAPLMEMQYGNDGKLYFLQYLKTGRILHDPGSFELPAGDNIVTVHDVRGATDENGEQIRIYLQPRKFTHNMFGQAFFDGLSMSNRGSWVEQVASINSRVVIVEYMLCFKDNHVSSAPLARAPVALGMWDGVGEAETKFQELTKQQPRWTVHDPVREVEYIDAVITSNGRKATIESDWVMKSEKLN